MKILHFVINEPARLDGIKAATVVRGEHIARPTTFVAAQGEFDPMVVGSAIFIANGGMLDE